MASTHPSAVQSIDVERAGSSTLQWRNWPLVDNRRTTWLVLAGILAIGGCVATIGQSWLLGLAAALGLGATLWQLFIPIVYEIGPAGMRRSALRHTHLIAWSAIRAYQLRTNGVILYRCMEPTKVESLRSLFLPYAPDEDETLCALRQHLPHAVELSG